MVYVDRIQVRCGVSDKESFLIAKVIGRDQAVIDTQDTTQVLELAEPLRVHTIIMMVWKGVLCRSAPDGEE